MTKIFDCDFCKNKSGVKNGMFVCTAFPDGVPYPEYIAPREKDECNNGIKFEPKTE